MSNNPEMNANTRVAMDLSLQHEINQPLNVEYNNKLISCLSKYKPWDNSSDYKTVIHNINYANSVLSTYKGTKTDKRLIDFTIDDNKYTNVDLFNLYLQAINFNSKTQTEKTIEGLKKYLKEAETVSRFGTDKTPKPQTPIPEWMQTSSANINSSASKQETRPSSRTATRSASGPTTRSASGPAKNQFQHHINEFLINEPQRISELKRNVLQPLIEKQESLGCGRHALNNLLGMKLFSKTQGFPFGKINEIDENIDLSNFSLPINLQNLCKYMSIKEPSLFNNDVPCPYNENYLYSVLIYALNLIGYSVEEESINYYKQTSPEYHTIKIQLKDEDDPNFIGFLVNKEAFHWICYRKLTNGKYMKFDSLNHISSSVEFDDITKTIGENKIYKVKFTGKVINRGKIEDEEYKIEALKVSKKHDNSRIAFIDLLYNYSYNESKYITFEEIIAIMKKYDSIKTIEDKERFVNQYVF